MNSVPRTPCCSKHSEGFLASSEYSVAMVKHKIQLNEEALLSDAPEELRIDWRSRHCEGLLSFYTDINTLMCPYDVSTRRAPSNRAKPPKNEKQEHIDKTMLRISRDRGSFCASRGCRDPSRLIVRFRAQSPSLPFAS